MQAVVTWRHRATLGAVAVALIVAGLVWRLVPFGLPAFWLRNGGGVLWGAMLFIIVAALRPVRAGLVACFLTTSFIAIGSEFFRLYHMPWLDAFRQTLAGALLIGRVFLIGNMVAYELGIAVAAGLYVAWRLETRSNAG
ncbi:DUF2809 domain-containing protein [Beijerinckia sp. L45]|uniref:ribosomal maturation YjgA family protein n=1 Tax=Beijerinckia sp. L45 TaxID=1641855 RepID=UPI00157585C8|nr:DUF2809 domain-containing protein [Beijerinckia sp. L45]